MIIMKVMKGNRAKIPNIDVTNPDEVVRILCDLLVVAEDE